MFRIKAFVVIKISLLNNSCSARLFRVKAFLKVPQNSLQQKEKKNDDESKKIQLSENIEAKLSLA